MAVLVSAIASPPRGRTTAELVALMRQHTTLTEARWILRRLERDGWIEQGDDETWTATPAAVATFGAIDWEATPL